MKHPALLALIAVCAATLTTVWSEKSEDKSNETGIVIGIDLGTTYSW